MVFRFFAADLFHFSENPVRSIAFLTSNQLFNFHRYERQLQNLQQSPFATLIDMIFGFLQLISILSAKIRCGQSLFELIYTFWFQFRCAEIQNSISWSIVSCAAVRHDISYLAADRQLFCVTPVRSIAFWADLHILISIPMLWRRQDKKTRHLDSWSISPSGARARSRGGTGRPPGVAGRSGLGKNGYWTFKLALARASNLEQSRTTKLAPIIVTYHQQ